MQTNQFDQIYHEHYYYWLITPLVKLFSEYGLNIIQIKDFIIYFEENNLINLERFGHYFYIHFNEKTTYKFIIKYNNDKLSY